MGLMTLLDDRERIDSLAFAAPPPFVLGDEEPCLLEGEDLTLLDRLTSLRRGIDQLELSFARLASQYMAESEHPESDYLDLREACHMSGHALGLRLGVGQQMDRMPESVAAVMEGEIGFQHLGVIAGLANRVPPDKFDESRMLKKAKKSSIYDLVKYAQSERHRLDPKGMAQDERQAAEERSFEMKAAENGGWFVEGWFDSVGGAVIKSALEPLARPRGKHDDRNRGKRLADALVEVCGGGAHAEIRVTCSLATLQGEPGSPAAHMEHAGPVSYEVLQRFACNASIRRIVFDSKSLVIDVGRARRVNSPAMEAAMHARDQGCVWPGCDGPEFICQGHHRQPVSEGGSSNLENMETTCYLHHEMCHAGWRMVRGPDGEVIVIPPLDRVMN